MQMNPSTTNSTFRTKEKLIRQNKKLIFVPRNINRNLKKPEKRQKIKFIMLNY